MQRIEKYGVIALVFLLVTILAVSLWGESKGDGFFSMFKSSPKKGAAASIDRPLRNRPAGQPLGEQPADHMLPLTTGDALATPGAQPMATPDALAQQQPNGLAQPVGTQPNAQPGVAADPYAALRGPNAPLITPGATNPTGAQPLGANPLAAQTPGTAVVRTNAPVQPATREYTVKPGDTLGEIASHELGSSARWVDIQRLNKMIEPSKLKVGMTLQLPVERGAVAANVAPKSDEPKKAAAGSAKPTAGRKYVVKTGDSLTSIASAELGSSTRWTEIRDLNPGIDPARIKVGATLVLPAGTTVAKASSREVASYTPTTPRGKSKVK